MTEDSDFKQVVRGRAAKTGESYQAARRQLERKRGGFSARVTTRFQTKNGLVVLGCIMEAGKVTRGMTVTVTTDAGATHRGVVVSLRHMWEDLDAVSHGEWGEFGLLLDPVYEGPTPAQVTG
jgi:translation initiation factor IF-2